MEAAADHMSHCRYRNHLGINNQAGLAATRGRGRPQRPAPRQISR